MHAGGTIAEWNRTIARYFDEAADSYRRWMDDGARALHMGFWDDRTQNHGEALQNMNRELARRADLRPGQRVLDAGCGVGGAALYLAEHKHVEVVGINITASQLTMAHQLARERGLEQRVRFVEGDFHGTDFEPESFDVVWAQEAVVHSPDKPAFLREAARLLKPGGRLVMEDGFRHARPYRPADERLIQAWAEGWAVPDLATMNEFTHWTVDAGLCDPTFEDITRHTLPSFRRMYVAALLKSPSTMVRASLGLYSAIKLGHRNSARYAWQLVSRHLMAICLFTAIKT